MSNPVPTTAESAVAPLLALVPDTVKTSRYEGYNTGGRVQARLTLDDGHGPASVVVNVAPARPGTAPQHWAGLSPMTSIRVITRPTTRSRVAAGPTSLPSTSPATAPIPMTLTRARMRSASCARTACGSERSPATAPAGHWAPPAPSPPLTTRQLYTIARDPRWSSHMDKGFVDDAASISVQGTGSS